MLERTGRWDEAIALSAELLHRGGPSPNIRLCPLNRLGTILARQGGRGVWEYLDEAIVLADGSGEPQQIVPVRLARAEAHWLNGQLADATHEAELADDIAAGNDAWERGAVAAWLRRTGSARPPRGQLAEPYRRLIDGDWAGAVRLWTELGCRLRGRPGAARRGRRGVAAHRVSDLHRPRRQLDRPAHPAEDA